MEYLEAPGSAGKRSYLEGDTSAVDATELGGAENVSLRIQNDSAGKISVRTSSESVDHGFHPGPGGI